MIKKIRIIKQVGVFSNFDSGNDKEFDKLTFVYGLNTYGKSTLCDIFKSLSAGDNEIIKKRKTKPEDKSKQQQIVLSVYDNDSNSELPITFQNDNWNNNIIAENLEIFDTAFVYENVFDGISLLDNRETKENFSDFILGAEGVKLGHELGKKRKDLRDQKKDLKKTIPDYVKNANDAGIQKFISLEVTETLESLKDEIALSTHKKDSLAENIQNKDKILQLPEPSKISVPIFDSLTNGIDNANTILKTSFDDLKEEAIAKLQEHIKHCLQNDNEAEIWIKKGLTFVSDDSCPFCGQDLTSAKELIGTYQAYFNQEYIEFIANIDDNLDRHISCISMPINSENAANQALLNLKEYSGKIDVEEYKNAVKAIEDSKVKIPELEKQINDTISVIKASLEKFSESKKQKPYHSIKTIEKNDLIDIIGQYQKILQDINDNIETTVKHISTYKDKFRNDTVSIELQGLKNIIQEYEKKKARLEQAEKCNEYTKKEEFIENLTNKVDRLSSSLEKDQNDYLEKYFDSIDSFFQKLGSKDYKIEKSRPSDRGDKKVYGITVKFKNKKVSNNDLQFVFSDSDRRALSLSIFWAKLSTAEDSEMTNKIIVLDDPVTSFDDNRIIKNNDIIWNFKDKANQIILLTHYPSFIKDFYKRCNPNDRSNFMEIKQNNKTSSLEKMDMEFFCCNEMEQQFYSISDFINKRSSADIRQKLRPYFENHLKILFLKSMIENNLLNQTLEVKINKLREIGLISGTIEKRLHKYRQETNPEAHIFTSNNQEDIRSFAEELLNFLYDIDLKEPIV
ncbi:MAG: AAA family ATPase [Candidatus Desulfaltia sp.]|nr:AAA family ATPase [Candidatus Desulfaltia sp.]